MSLKREYQDVEIMTAVTLSHSKRVRPAPAAPKRKAFGGVISDSSLSSPTKKPKLILRLAAQDTSTPRGIQCTADKCAGKTTPNGPLNKSRLVPRGARKSAKLSHKDETLLRLLCNDIVSGEQTELHFRRIPHSAIDWNDIEHINKINNWRNQIYGRAGLKSKIVNTWLPDEELWFELYYQLSIAESRTRGMLIPKTVQVLRMFNETFVGQVLQDSHGKTMEPRIERQANAFASKFNRMCLHLKARLTQSVLGKSGDAFVPSITMAMLQTYKQMKTAMADKGIKTESAYAENLAEWLHLFSHLPFTSQDRPVTSVENDAAAALMSMATQSVDVYDCVKVEDEWPNTPELLRNQSFSSSLRSNGPSTPPCWSSEGTIALLEKPRSFTPINEFDIAALIASPD